MDEKHSDKFKNKRQREKQEHCSSIATFWDEVRFSNFSVKLWTEQYTLEMKVQKFKAQVCNV